MDATEAKVLALREDPDQFIAIARYDWLVTKNGNRLHYVYTWLPEHLEDMAENWGVFRPVRLACGRTAAGVWIPGVFTRMGAQRCGRCCKVAGLPLGKGSPKNDPECRAILGLEQPQSTPRQPQFLRTSPALAFTVQTSAVPGTAGTVTRAPAFSAPAIWSPGPWQRDVMSVRAFSAVTESCFDATLDVDCAGHRFQM